MGHGIAGLGIKTADTLELLSDLPSNVVGVRAKGEVTKNDLETTLMPALDAAVERHGHIHYLLLLETDVKNWDFGAWISDARAGIKHFTKWKKIAVVTDQESVRKVSDALSPVFPGETRGYPMAELEAARQWVSTEE